jgi:hypothetical protein
MRTISQKLLSGVLAAGMMVSATSFAATNIGTGSVVGSGSLTSNVVWDDNFPGFATGTVNGLLVQARVLPVLDMVISGSGTIDLGTLTSAAYNSGSVSVEVGTNAVNGASVTVRSTNGGLQNISSPSVYINNLTADEVADSYRFTAVVNGTDDSSYAAFAQSTTIASGVEVADNTTAHVLYSSTKPQKLDQVDDVVFTVSAKPDIETPAGQYRDVVVVTVSGSF